MLPRGVILNGSWRVDRPLADGGTSRIYLGNPLRGAGVVAIKQARTEDADELRHFQREYELLRSLSHPGLPRGLDAFVQDGLHYLVEELVPGDTLEERLAKWGKLPANDALPIAFALLDILGYLHQCGVIYRDLKPSNVLLGRDGRVRLIDFGAARRWRADVKKDTVPLGTPGYAAPEQYGTAQTDARSDVFSCGALLHHMLTGVEPEGWIREAPRDVPRHVGAAVMRALSLAPEARFESAYAMREALIGPRNYASTVGRAYRSSHGSRLVGLRGRYHFPRLLAYVRGSQKDWSLALGVGLLVGLVDVLWGLTPGPEVLATVPLTFATWRLGHAWLPWLQARSTVVETFDEGLRFQDRRRYLELQWHEITEVKVVQEEDTAATRSAELRTAYARIHIDGRWPALDPVVDETIRNAGLVLAPGQTRYPMSGLSMRRFIKP